MNNFVILVFLVVSLSANPVRGVEVLEEILEQKYAVDRDATLSVHNTDGAIRIYGADVPEISIQAIKKAYTSDRLKQIVIDVKATPRNVVIETIFPPKRSGWSLNDRSGTVEYIIVVPETTKISQLDLVNGEVLVEGLRGGSARAHLINGWLGCHNCFGDLDLTLVNGRLDIAYDWWENTTFSAKAHGMNGNLRVIVPPDASLDIAAETVSGRIGNAFAGKKQNGADVVRSLATSIGTETGAQISLSTDAGNIRIDKSY